MALPLWPLFLAEREFVTHGEAEPVAASLRQRLRQLPKVLDHAVYDPALQEPLQSTFPSVQDPPEVSMTPVTSHWFEVVLVWIAILSFQETAFNR